MRGANAGLIKLIMKGLPLPFAGLRNERSLIGVRNLASFLVQVALSTKSSGQDFLVADDERLGLDEFARTIGRLNNKPNIVFSVPSWGIIQLAKLVGKSEFAQRLICNNALDDSKARDLLGWKAPFSFEEEILNYLESQS